MLIDAFTYFNEKELSELRIKYLDSIVDYFVVIESNITFAGKKKKWNFPEVLNGNLKAFSHKIQYHQLNININEIKNEESWIIDEVKGDDFWRIENYQRNYIKTACKKFSEDDILMVSDLDEIPSIKKINFILTSDFKKIAPIALEQYLFHLDCNYLRLESWRGTVVMTIDICNKFSPQKFRTLRNRISHLTAGGWSFSSFGGYNRVKEKIESYAHSEHNNDKFKSEEHIANCQRTGADLFHSGTKSKKVEKSFFPKDLLILMEENPKFYFGSNI